MTSPTFVSKENLRDSTTSSESTTDSPEAFVAFDKVIAPIPIATVRSQLELFKDDCFKRLLLRYSGADVLPNGWQLGLEGHGIQVQYGQVTGTSWQTIKSTGLIHQNADRLANLLSDVSSVPQYDSMTKSVRTLEKLDENCEVRLASCKTVMLISPRDLCVVTAVRREADGRILIATRSVEHPNSHQSGFTRAIAMISGYVITPTANDENCCEVSAVAHIDLAGNIPSFALRYVGLSAPLKMVRAIRDLAEKQKA